MNTKGGNLLKLKRHDAAGTIIDSMSYFYTLNAQQKLVNNKLNSVRDTGSTAAGMPLGRSSYVYDHDGRLARDMKENLNMRWTIDNKLRQVQKGNRFIRYWYDASGQRVMKRLHGDTVDYVFRDAAGNELERITRRNNSSTPILVKAEANLYGSSRIGVHELATTATPDTVEQRASNSHTYELTDHLGNVRATVGDRKTFTAITGGYSLSALVRSASDVYPYGMPISTRSFSANTYRFGFNTQEKSTEINSSGSHTTALFWEYDSRTGRRWNRDPVTYPWQSPYAINNNNPIIFSDPLGLFGSRKEARKYRREHNTGGRIRIDNEGYYSFDNKKAGTSIFKDMESGKVWTAVLVTAERSDQKTITPFQLGVEWLTGGPRSRDFKSGDYTVELYKQHEHYQKAISDVSSKLRNLPANTTNPDYGYPYELDGLEGVGKYVKDYSTLATGGTTGNLMFTYLGSHSLWIEVTANDIVRRVATVTFTVHNMSTLESATRLPYIGYKEWYMNSVGNFLNTKVAGRTGPTSETEQVFQWTEPIKY